MSIVDQLDRTIEIQGRPTRVVSLVPSITELLFDLGLGDLVVGRTSFCHHPKGVVNSVPEVGGTKNFSVDSIKLLAPDIIFVSKEENAKELVEELMVLAPVFVTDVVDFRTADDMILSVAALFGKEDGGEKIIFANRSTIDKVRREKRGSCLYLIWHKPMMTVGGDTYISHVLESIGYENIYKSELRYPTVSEGFVNQSVPDYVFLSSEPFSFVDKHKEHYSNLWPHSCVKLVSGEFFSWYGSRLGKMSDFASTTTS